DPLFHQSGQLLHRRDLLSSPIDYLSSHHINHLAQRLHNYLPRHYFRKKNKMLILQHLINF
ncbi:hypothetical protein NE599_21960, partial [[Clostridium] symbiosum]